MQVIAQYSVLNCEKAQLRPDDTLTSSLPLDIAYHSFYNKNMFKPIKPNFYDVFSKFTIDKIEVIHTLASVGCGTASNSDLIEQFKMKNQALGGILASLSRKDFKGESLIQPVAKHPEAGTIWRLNPKVASTEEIRKVTTDILSKVGKWRKNK